MGTLLALDLASTVGWALAPRGMAPARTVIEGGRPDASLILSGIKELRPPELRVHDGDGIHPAMGRLGSWLHKLIAAHGVEAIYYEAPLDKGRKHEHANTSLYLKGYIGVAACFAHIHGIRTFLAVSHQDIKKFWVGSGHASKDDMVRMAELMYGRQVASDDEADGLALLELALAQEWRRARGLVA